MAKDLAIVLNNGSINSAVATALAAQKYRTVLLHMEVAPQPGSRTRAAYDQQVAHFKPYREHSLVMPYLSLLAGAAHQPQAVTDPRHPAPLGPQMQELLPLVAAAVRFAAHYHAAAVYMGLRVGPHGDELAQATEYGQVWNELIQLPCNLPEMEVVMPLLELEPWQVVETGFQVATPFDKTWSCTEESGEPCWACRGCRAREAAFHQAGKADPLRAVKGGRQ
ncbi:MAG: queC [Phycisphaerales bacterium]|jgi:7-cyano-7-deazaguanine synthase in queuosine biosynthesis|nr:queC [Phycisphaerales bacterium]MDB5356361.1 queC [Phycisphaerales bacterium]